MSAVISGSSVGPGGSSVSGVGTGSRSSNSSGNGSYSDNVIYATNARSEYAPYSLSVNSSKSNLDYINRYNNMIVSNANDRYDDRFSRMLEYNNANFQKALDFSERMSNTAIQRQVQDLIKAGLNPILASRLGGANYSMPSIPYVNSVANPNYALYDSNAYNAELDYDVSKESNQIEILKNATQYLMNHERLLNDKEIAEMNSATSLYNSGKMNEQEWARVIERLGMSALTTFLIFRSKGDKGNGNSGVLLPTEKAELIYKQYTSIPHRTALSFADYVVNNFDVPKDLLQFLPTLSKQLAAGLGAVAGALAGSQLIPVM